MNRPGAARDRAAKEPGYFLVWIGLWIAALLALLPR